MSNTVNAISKSAYNIKAIFYQPFSNSFPYLLPLVVGSRVPITATFFSFKDE